MSKTKKRQKIENEDFDREERILDQLKMNKRIPVPPPGYYHDTGEKQQRRKNRKQEKIRLKNLTRDYDENDYNEEEGD